MLEQDMTDEEFEPYFAKAQEVSQFFREIGPKYDQENTFAYRRSRRSKSPGSAHFRCLGHSAAPAATFCTSRKW